MARPDGIDLQLKVATQEILWKALAALVLKTSLDPNAKHYLSNTFENSVDVLIIHGAGSDADALQVREQLRLYGQSMIDSVFRETGRPGQ